MEQQRHRARAASAGDDFPDITDRQDRHRAHARTGTGKTEPPPTKRTTELGPGVRVGDYEIEAKIGEGAMGAVYRAVHPAIGKRVAIKVMTPKLFDEPESVKRFVAEARAVAAIRHPGIVDIFGFGRVPDGRTYLVMEWLDGSTLGARLQNGAVSFEEACDFLRQISRGLDAAHAKGIIHRDLKPDNVFIHHIDGEKPQCKLLDFGLAKVTNKEDGLVAKTRTGQLLGTPLYMSPEQCKSKGVDHRTDIYALGCMAYEMLCGRVPFDADNVAELISAHLVGDRPRPRSLKPDLPAELDGLLYRMIAKNPDERPTLAELRRVLSGVLSRSSQPLAAVTPDDLTPPPLALPRNSTTGSAPASILTPPASSVEPVAEPEAVAAVKPRVPWLGIVGALVIILIAIAIIAAVR